MSIPDTLTPDQRQTLSAQVIDENGPGTILRDFEVLLDFIGPKGIEVGGKHQLLPMKQLVELNARLARPIEIDLKRPVQKSYPHINGLYLLLRACGLACVESSGKKQRLVINEEALQSWKTLNPTERYFTLLETWLLRAKIEILGERSALFNSPFIKCYEFWRGIPERGLKVAGDKNAEERIRYIPGLYNVALLELFGLLSVKHCKPAEGGGWCIASVQRTAFGNALVGLLFELLQNSNLLFGEEYGTEEEAGDEFGRLQPTLQPFFPEWHNNLVLPKLEFQDGLFIFKVSLGKIWRRIAIPAEANLESLANHILNAFDFDYDHLYQFTYQGRFGYPIHVNHPYIRDEPPCADEVRVGDLHIKPGTAIDFLYDFGDQWLFQVQLERIDPADSAITGPKLIDSHGEAPEQYPDTGEWF
jgi:hypothetical protein